MRRRAQWSSTDTNSIRQFSSIVDHTKLNTHTLTHLEQVIVLLSFWNPGIVKKLLTPCCCSLLSVSTLPVILLFSLYPMFYFFLFLISSTDFSLWTDPMSFLYLLLSSYLYPPFPPFPFCLSSRRHFLVLSSLQFVLSQVQRLQSSIRVTVMQRAVQSRDQPPSVPRALTQGESMLLKDAGNTFFHSSKSIFLQDLNNQLFLLGH